MRTEHVRISEGAVVGRSSVPFGTPGHPGKGWYARHDRGKPQHNPNTHTYRQVMSLAEQDEDVRYELVPRPIGDVRAWACDAIDSAADERISANRTPGIGINSVYEAQRAEMIEYMALSSSGQQTPAALFPVLSALVGSTVGADLAAVAETIRQRVTSEAARMATINRSRLDGKAAVAAAGTVEAVASAVDSARAAIAGS